MTRAVQLDSVHAGYLRIPVLRGIDLHVDRGETVSIIGNNGAGKSTLMKTIVGLLHPSSGTVTVAGVDTTHSSPDRVVDLGAVLVPEGREVFTRMSVHENLLVGAHKRKKYDELEHVHSLFPVLHERSDQLAGTLSGGEQQMLAIGRALMARPSTLLLDEPSLGLAPLVVDKLVEALRLLQADGLTIILVEQDVSLGLEMADRSYVLERGEIALSGPTQNLAADQRIIDTYLGSPDAGT